MTTQQTQETIRELESVRRQARWWGWGTTGAIVLISLISIGALAHAVRNLFQPGPTRDQFAAALQGNLKTNVLPPLQTLASQTLSESRPQVEAAFTSLNARVPEMTGTFMKQFDLLRVNLPARGDKALSDTYGLMLQQQEPKIKAMFPDVTDANVATFVTNMTSAGQQQIVKANDTLFAKHTAVLNSIITDMDTIQRTEPMPASEDQANWEMALTVVDAFHDDLQGLRVQNTNVKNIAASAAKANGKEAKQ